MTSNANSIKRGVPAPSRRDPATPRRLERFAARLALHRKNLNLKQSEIAHELSKLTNREISQSLVAQLEKGKATNPDSELLCHLAVAYDVPYLTLVSDIIADKYEVLPFKASLVARDILDVSGLAAWERALPHKSVLWIAAPNFVDDKNKEMRDVVVKILKDGGAVKYFVDQRDTGPGRKFETLKAEFAQHSGLSDSRVPEWMPLDDKQVAVLSTGFVIANPDAAFGDNPQAVGYQIINDADGMPEFGIRMALPDLQQRVTLVRGFNNVIQFKPVVEKQ